MYHIPLIVGCVLLSSTVVAQDNVLTDLYDQMNADVVSEKRQKSSELDAQAKSIIGICRKISSFSAKWKQDFSQKNRINSKSILFVGARVEGGQPLPRCYVKSSSDRGVCDHEVIFLFLELNPAVEIRNDCK